MKFVIDEPFSRPFLVLRMIAEFAIYLAQALAVVGAFIYAFGITGDRYVGIALYVIRNAVFVYIVAWPITGLVELGKVFPAGADGKYEVPAWMFVVYVFSMLGLMSASFLALDNLPKIIAPLLKN